MNPPCEPRSISSLRPALVRSLLDQYRLVHGCLEAKDDADDLEDEMRAKLKLGYPAKNTLFWQPRRALLVQDGKVARDLPLIAPDGVARPENLVELLAVFFSYTEPALADWEHAVDEFRERLPELGRSVGDLIQKARGPIAPNKKFVATFDAFTALCRTAINPTLSVEAVEEMLIQHLLTARLFGSVFSNPEFTRRNVVAQTTQRLGTLGKIVAQALPAFRPAARGPLRLAQPGARRGRCQHKAHRRLLVRAGSLIHFADIIFNRIVKASFSRAQLHGQVFDFAPIHT